MHLRLLRQRKENNSAFEKTEGQAKYQVQTSLESIQLLMDTGSQHLST
jgi:hypothetical protein